jgi:hypothetical protein
MTDDGLDKTGAIGVAFGKIGVSTPALAIALLAGCGEAPDVPAEPAPTATPAPTPSAPPTTRPHTPIMPDMLAGKAFTITGAEDYVDFVRFESGTRYFETLRGEEVARGDYVLTPDGRLCFLIDDSAASNCWRQVAGEEGSSTIHLKFNASDRRIALIPVDAAEDEG